MKFPESPLAHQLLDGLQGLEIGGSSHNPFGLATKNVDYTADMDTVFKINEEILCGEKLPVDVVAPGDALPFPDASQDFVISSHVIEHFFDPIAAIKEWLRVVKPGGYVYIIAPLPDAIPDEDRPCTTLSELLDRHEGRMVPAAVNMGAFQTSTVSGLPFNEHGHWSVWDLHAFLPICAYFGWPVVATQAVDDKVGNGFTVVIQKR